MTAQSRFALAVLLLAAPMAARAQHTHAAPAAPAPAAAPHVAPAPAADDELLADADLWSYDDLFALGLDDDPYLDGGGLGDGDLFGGPDGPMAMADDADGGADAPGMRLGPGGVNGGPGAGMHLGTGMRGRMGMGGGMGMRGGMGMGGMMHRRMGMGMHARLAQLELTEAQRTKLRDLHESHARKAVQRRADLQLAQMDLRKLLRADRPEQGAINAQVDKITRLRAEGLKSAIDTRLQARAVLTPEQWKALHAPRRPMSPPMMKHDMMDGPEAPKR